jgi:hypothetical protein
LVGVGSVSQEYVGLQLMQNHPGRVMRSMSNNNIIDWLKRTATVCYVMGVWLIIVLIAVFAIAFQAAYEVVYSGITLQQAFTPFVPIIIGFSSVNAILSVLFAIGSIKIGKNYSSVALAFVGVTYLLSTIISLILSPWALATTNAGIVGGQLVTTRDPSVTLISSINELISLLGYVGLVIAGFTMKQKTNIGAFTAVSVLAIIGILVGFIIPIAILVLGAAFSQMASKLRKIGQPSTEQAREIYSPLNESRSQTVEQKGEALQIGEKTEAPPGSGERTTAVRYCPYCGGKVRTDDLFCPICGSSLPRKNRIK